MTGIVAGVVIETLSGAAPRVAARLVGRSGVELQGGDGDHRLAAVLTARDGDALERFAEEVIGADPEVLGIFPTFVGEEEGGGSG